MTINPTAPEGRCDGPDDPAKRCGRHHPTENGNIMGGYDCCCGQPWLPRRDRCMSGANRGDPTAPVGADDLRDRYARAIAQAIYRQPDPSWCLLDVCMPYATVVMAVRDEELERLRAEVERLADFGVASRELHRAEIERLRAELAKAREERDLAIAHDRQPYPTADAYERACKALWHHRERADKAEVKRDALKAAIGDVRRLCEMTIATSCRVQAIDQATDTLAVLDRALDTPDTAPETPEEN